MKVSIFLLSFLILPQFVMAHSDNDTRIRSLEVRVANLEAGGVSSPSLKYFCECSRNGHYLSLLYKSIDPLSGKINKIRRIKESFMGRGIHSENTITIKCKQLKEENILCN